MELSLEDLAATPVTPPDQLAGRCRGDLLGPWGDNVARRFGAAGLARVRQRLPSPLDQLPPVLSARDWVPIGAQLVVTEAIVDELLAGDWLALLPLLIEDTRAGVGRVQLALLRTMGPGNAFKLTSRTFAKVYEQGAADAQVSGRTARLTFTGNPIFAHPRWRLMQLFAMRVMLDLANAPGTVSGEDAAGFIAIARW